MAKAMGNKDLPDSTPKSKMSGNSTKRKASKPKAEKDLPIPLPSAVESQLEVPGLLTGLTPKQLRAAQWLMLGYNPPIVASKVGVALTTITNWRKLPVFQAACDLLRDGGAEKLVAELEDFRSAEQILEDAAVRAAEKTTEIMESAEKDETQLRAAESILDRTGRARKTEVHKHIVMVEADALKLIEQTKQQIQEAEFELLPEGEEDNDGYE